MSYISCVNSALIDPVSYPVGAVGYVNIPVINTTAGASGATIQAIAGYTLPKGIWAVFGTLFVDSVTGGQTLLGVTQIAKDGVVFWRNQNPATVEDGLSVSLSAVLSSDGTNVLTVPVNYTTSGGANYGISASPATIIEIARIA